MSNLDGYSAIIANPYDPAFWKLCSYCSCLLKVLAGISDTCSMLDLYISKQHISAEGRMCIIWNELKTTLAELKINDIYYHSFSSFFLAPISPAIIAYHYPRITNRCYKFFDRQNLLSSSVAMNHKAPPHINTSDSTIGHLNSPRHAISRKSLALRM